MSRAGLCCVCRSIAFMWCKSYLVACVGLNPYRTACVGSSAQAAGPAYTPLSARTCLLVNFPHGCACQQTSLDSIRTAYKHKPSPPARVQQSLASQRAGNHCPCLQDPLVLAYILQGPSIGAPCCQVFHQLSGHGCCEASPCLEDSLVIPSIIEGSARWAIMPLGSNIYKPIAYI